MYLHLPSMFSSLMFSLFYYAPVPYFLATTWSVHVRVQKTSQTHLLPLHVCTNVPLSSTRTWTPFHHPLNVRGIILHLIPITLKTIILGLYCRCRITSSCCRQSMGPRICRSPFVWPGCCSCQEPLSWASKYQKRSPFLLKLEHFMVSDTSRDSCAH